MKRDPQILARVLGGDVSGHNILAPRGHLNVKKADRRSLVFDDDLKAWLAGLPAKNVENSKLAPTTP